MEFQDEYGNWYYWSYIENCIKMVDPISNSDNSNRRQDSESINEKLLLLTEECTNET